MVQTTNPKGAAKAEVVRIIPWLQVRILPVLFHLSNSVIKRFVGSHSRPPRSRAGAFLEHILRYIDRQDGIAGDGDRDGVARAGIDFDQFAVAFHAQLGEVHVVA
jgi:hypothetical protein